MEYSKTTFLISFVGKLVELLLLRDCPHIAIRVAGTSNCIIKQPGQNVKYFLAEKMFGQLSSQT